MICVVLSVLDVVGQWHTVGRVVQCFGGAGKSGAYLPASVVVHSVDGREEVSCAAGGIMNGLVRLSLPRT